MITLGLGLSIVLMRLVSMMEVKRIAENKIEVDGGKKENFSAKKRLRTGKERKDLRLSC